VTVIRFVVLILAVSATAAAAELPRIHEPDPRERHFGPLLMLTDGAENAEAYWSLDGHQLIFQSNRPPFGCDQIYVMPATGGEVELVSTGKGRTTCAYFAGPDDRYVVYASTHGASPDCPPPPDLRQGYVWPIYDSYEIVRLDRKTGELVDLTDHRGYDAEATVSPDGRTIVFTSTRDGDLDIYTMDLEGGRVKRLTSAPGYDGGPFFSPDGTRIVYRAHHPEGEALADYRALLAEGLVRPGRLEVWVMNADGTDQRPVTDLGCASFAPFFHPSGEKIIFSTNYPEPRGREFDLWLVNVDGSGLERVTWTADFDGFPMFSPDGQRLVFASNRHNGKPGETNIFVTEWRD
jgi:Tol biopolymer transport system component